MFTNIRLRYLVLGLLLLNVCLTFFSIGSIPGGQTYDEIIYLSEARSILKYGSDLSGTWRPWFFAPSDGWYAELTSTTWVPGFALFPNNPLLASRFVSGVLGSVLPVALALIIVRVYRKKELIVPVGLILSFNPWIFEFSRMSFDSLPSVTMYSVGLALMLWLSGWKKLYSIPFFFWGFYQYQGHKPLLVPFVMLAVWLLLQEYWDSRVLTEKKKHFISQIQQVVTKNVPVFSIALVAVLLTVSYVVRMPSLTSSVRTQNFAIFDEELIASTVNEQRRVALDSPVTALFDNKLVEKSKLLLASFFVSFDPGFLFLHGDARIDSYAVLNHGFLYWLDVPLIALFLVLVASQKKYRRASLFMVLFVVLATLPNVLRSGDIWITFRGAFVFLGLANLAAIGMGFLLEQLPRYQKMAVIALYSLGVVGYLYVYFVQYPVQQTKHEGFYYRVMASYVQRVGQRKTAIVPDRSDAFLDYLVVYNNLLQQVTHAEMIAAKTTTGIKKLGTVSIYPDCPREDPVLQDQDTVLVVDYRRDPCAPDPLEQSHIELLSVVDSGTRFSVYNDQLCDDVALPDYLKIKKNVFAVEKLSDAEFCSSFFVRR